MIRINLANTSGAPISAGGVTFEVDGGSGGPGDVQKQGLIRLIIIVLPVLALWGYQNMRIPELQAQRNNLQTQLNELTEYNVRKEKSVQEIKRFQEDEQKIQARIAYLEKIAKGRLREIKVLDLIQQVIPEKVWLNKVDSVDGRVTLGGMAMSDFEISSFMEALSKSVFFVDVKLMSSAETIFDNLNLKKFEIVCVVEGPKT